MEAKEVHQGITREQQNYARYQGRRNQQWRNEQEECADAEKKKYAGNSENHAYHDEHLESRRNATIGAPVRMNPIESCGPSPIEDGPCPERC